MSLPGVLLIETRIFRDQRGHFLESWNEQRYKEMGIEGPFVQDNISVSARGVLRGLHFQRPYPQAKLVSVLRGEVFDVAVDVRDGSDTFGEWVGAELSAENGRQMYIPEGFAHGFVVTSDFAIFSYKCSEYYHPEAEHTLLWSDSDLAIGWPTLCPVLSEKDRAGVRLRNL